MEAPFDTLLLGIDCMEAEHVFDKHRDGPQCRPSAEVFTHDVAIAAHDRVVAARAVAFPDCSWLDRLIGAIHVREQVFGSLIGFGLIAVFFDGLGAHVSSRKPDASAPVVAIFSVIVAVIACNGYPRANAAKGLWIT